MTQELNSLGKEVNSQYPNWLLNFVKLARPGVMVGMFSLIIFGGLLFAFIEFLVPGRGHNAMVVFVGFLAGIDDNYYNTLIFMFGFYVAGRSSQDIFGKALKIKEIKGGINRDNQSDADTNNSV